MLCPLLLSEDCCSRSSTGPDFLTCFLSNRCFVLELSTKRLNGTADDRFRRPFLLPQLYNVLKIVKLPLMLVSRRRESLVPLVTNPTMDVLMIEYDGRGVDGEVLYISLLIFHTRG